jgi:hypothetical protein
MNSFNKHNNPNHYSSEESSQEDNQGEFRGNPTNPQTTSKP